MAECDARAFCLALFSIDWPVNRVYTAAIAHVETGDTPVKFTVYRARSRARNAAVFAF